MPDGREIEEARVAEPAAHPFVTVGYRLTNTSTTTSTSTLTTRTKLNDHCTNSKTQKKNHRHQRKHITPRAEIREESELEIKSERML